MKIMKGKKAFLWKVAAALIILALFAVPVFATFPTYADDGGAAAPAGDTGAAPAADAPAADAPAAEAPAADAPAADAPAADTPAVEAPVADAPAADAPAADTPAVEAPVADAPAVDAPAADAPAGGGNAPAVTTNASDYAASETPVITVSYLAPNSQTTVTITAPDGTVTDMVATTDTNGNATITYAPEGGLLKGEYNVTATDGTTTVTAVFTDALNYNFEQWANDLGPTHDISDWITGDLHGTNSTYTEGDAVPFLLTITDFGAGTHEITITYDYSRYINNLGIDVGGYDYLTKYNESENGADAPTLPAGSFAWDATGAFYIQNTALTVTGSTAPSGGNNKEATVTIELNATIDTNPVYVLWGGHLTKANTDPTPLVGYNPPLWGLDQGVSNISGAPIHMDTNAPGTGNRSLQPSGIISEGVFNFDKEGPEYAHVGDTITYTFYVYNGTTGTEYQDNKIFITDIPALTITYFSGDTADLGNLNPGETWVYHATYTIPNPSGDVVNNATLKLGNNGIKPDVELHDTWTVDVLNPAISVTKTVNGGPSAKTHSGDLVNYTITVTNTGDCDLTIGTGDNVLGTLGTGLVLHPTESYTYTPTASPTADVTNTVTATGVDALGGPKGTKTATASASVDVLNPAISVTKTVNGGPSATTHSGDLVNYTITVTNTGDCDLTIGTVDNKLGTLGTGLVLTPGQSKTYTPTANPAVDVTNTVTATGVDALGGPKGTKTASASASVDVLHPAISVTKTGPLTATVGDTITFTIDVTNPGDIALNGTTVQESLLVGAVYVSGDTNGNSKLDTNETWVYSVSYVVQPGDVGQLTNTVTASGWDLKPGDMTVTSTEAFWTVIVTAVTPAPPGAALATVPLSECPETLIINLMGTVAGYPVKTDCTLCEDVAMTSPDGSFVLNIPQGTQMLNSDGSYAYTNPGDDIVGTFAGTPAAPSGATIVRAYQLSPNGIVFKNHNATLAAKYNPADVPQGSSLIWAYYDDSAGQWINMDTAGYVAGGVEVPDTLATTTAHLTYFAILATSK